MLLGAREELGKARVLHHVGDWCAADGALVRALGAGGEGEPRVAVEALHLGSEVRRVRLVRKEGRDVSS